MEEFCTIDNQHGMHFFKGKHEFLVISESLDREKATVTLTMKGQLTYAAANPVRDELNALVSVGLNAVLIMEELNCIDYASLEALMKVQRWADVFQRGSLTLTRLSPEVMAFLSNEHALECLMIE